jgi:hypothetical protein
MSADSAVPVLKRKIGVISIEFQEPGCIDAGPTCQQFDRIYIGRHPNTANPVAREPRADFSATLPL